MARSPDFFDQLSRPDLEQLQAFAREPKATLKRVHEWMLAHGWTASKSAVHRWLKRFREQDRQSDAAELADAIYTANSATGAVDVAGAVNLQLAQRLQSALVKGGDKLAMGDLLKGAMAVNAITNAQGKLVELKQKQVEAVRAAEAMAKSGTASATDVVATIKAALGIAA